MEYDHELRFQTQRAEGRRSVPGPAAFAVTLLVSLSPVWGGELPVQDSSPAQGKRIGEAVLAAINVALPGVKDLVAALWSGVKDSDKISKKDAEARIAAARLELLKSAKVAITPVGAVARELDVFIGFLEPVTIANERLTVIRTRLEHAADVGPSSWAAISTEWKVAHANLKQLDDKKLDLSAVRDLAVRADLRKIQNANNTIAIEISDAVSQKDGALLSRRVEALTTLLNGVNALVGLEMLALRAEINELVGWAEGKGALKADDSSRKAFEDLASRSLKGVQ